MKKNNYLYLAIFTFFTILAWIGFDLYHISVSSTIPEEMKQDVIPFNPHLDTKVVKMIRERKKTSEFLEGAGEAIESTGSAAIESTRSAGL